MPEPTSASVDRHHRRAPVDWLRENLLNLMITGCMAVGAGGAVWVKYNVDSTHQDDRIATLERDFKDHQKILDERGKIIEKSSDEIIRIDGLQKTNMDRIKWTEDNLRVMQIRDQQISVLVEQVTAMRIAIDKLSDKVELLRR